MERDILLLGDHRLYELSQKVTREEFESLKPVWTDMFDCIRGIRRRHGFGRAIAAPQIGVKKRLICILTDRPYVIINQRLPEKIQKPCLYRHSYSITFHWVFPQLSGGDFSLWIRSPSPPRASTPGFAFQAAVSIKI